MRKHSPKHIGELLPKWTFPICADCKKTWSERWWRVLREGKEVQLCTACANRKPKERK